MLSQPGVPACEGDGLELGEYPAAGGEGPDNPPDLCSVPAVRWQTLLHCGSNGEGVAEPSACLVTCLDSGSKLQSLLRRLTANTDFRNCQSLWCSTLLLELLPLLPDCSVGVAVRWAHRVQMNTRGALSDGGTGSPPRRWNTICFDCGHFHFQCSLSAKTRTSRVAWI